VKGKSCDAYLLDLSGDGKPEVIVVPTERDFVPIFGENAQHEWRRVGSLPWSVGGCKSLRQKLTAGNLRALPPVLNDLEVSGVRLRVSAVDDDVSCPAQ